MNVHTVTLQGLRDQNEDKHITILNSDNKNPDLKNVNFFAVYDGHGGKTVSQFLHDNMAKYFMNTKVNYPISKKYVISVFDRLQKILINESFSKHMGSTSLVAIHFKHNNENYLNVINTGDSRCIICRDNFGMPLTKDHKPNWPEERHRITKLGGNITYDGYDWRIKDLSVSRAFGDVDATPYVTHRPTLYRYKLDKTDKFIVLACDGLWDKMSNDEVVNFILLHCYDETTNNRINKNINVARKLGEYALKKGSTDNISIIVVFLK
jgi:serine/threonine protein phosphatase PrpC